MQIDSRKIVVIFLHEMLQIVSMPLKLVTHRDPRFTGKFFAELCRLLGVEQCLSTAYHPQWDGQTERMNRILEEMLRHYARRRLR